jgi:hypothetical protein
VTPAYGADAIARRIGRDLRLFRHVLSRERMPSETLGLCLIVLGTVIWAFGDLVGRLAP